MRLGVIGSVTLILALSAAGPIAVRAQANLPAQQSNASPSARLQSALDEWRVSAGMPGAALGVVLKNGQVIGLASGLADRTAKRALTVLWRGIPVHEG